MALSCASSHELKVITFGVQISIIQTIIKLSSTTRKRKARPMRTYSLQVELHFSSYLIKGSRKKPYRAPWGENRLSFPVSGIAVSNQSLLDVIAENLAHLFFLLISGLSSPQAVLHLLLAASGYAAPPAYRQRHADSHHRSRVLWRLHCVPPSTTRLCKHHHSWPSAFSTCSRCFKQRYQSK